MKPVNQKAWFLVLPVLILVAISAVIPLMMVVNFSVQEKASNGQFFWMGTKWYETVLHDEKFWGALARSLSFSAIILAIQIPLGIFIALNMPRKGWGVPLCLVLMALPLLIPWYVVGMIWQMFGRVDIGLLGVMLKDFGVQLCRRSRRCVGHAYPDGCLALDQPRRPPVLCRPRLDP